MSKTLAIQRRKHNFSKPIHSRGIMSPKLLVNLRRGNMHAKILPYIILDDLFMSYQNDYCVMET